MSSIQASIFRPRALKFRVVVRYVEEMVNMLIVSLIHIWALARAPDLHWNIHQLIIT